MPRRTTNDRLDLLRKKRDELDAQLRALEARKKGAERKADTRRKVIAGALALEHYMKNPGSEFGRVMFRLLDEYVTRPHDRALFSELPVREEGGGPTHDFNRAGREASGGAPSPA